MSEVIRFTCKDRKDQPHDYVVTPFGFDEGFDLLNEIIERTRAEKARTEAELEL